MSPSANRPGRAAATASTPVTRPSTMNGTVETDGAVRSHAAGLSPLAARTPRSPSSSATRAYALSADATSRAVATQRPSSAS